MPGITELGTNSLTHDESKTIIVYLTPNRAYALFYISNLEINHVTCGVTDEGFIRYDELMEELRKSLLHNKENGILYHYADQLVGDYDKCRTENEIIEMIKTGVYIKNDKKAAADIKAIAERILSYD